MERALVVCDCESEGIQSVETALSDAGFRIVRADNVDNILRCIYSMSPQVLVIGEDSTENRELFSQIRDASSVPIIAVYGQENLAVRILLYDLGVDACMSTPVKRLELIARAHSLLRRYKESYKIN